MTAEKGMSKWDEEAGPLSVQSVSPLSKTNGKIIWNQDPALARLALPGYLRANDARVCCFIACTGVWNCLAARLVAGGGRPGRIV